MGKNILIAGTAIVALSLGLVIGSNTKASTAVAPAECGTAMDLSSEYVAAAQTEHQALDAAFTKASQDGDVAAMLKDVRAAIEAMNSTSESMRQPMKEASKTCYAATK